MHYSDYDLGYLEGIDPDTIPQDFHNINVEQAVRLTPATLAYHITQGLWYPARHLLHVASIIARALLEGNAHIIISMPPRHGKSELLSINTPIWFLDLFPEDPVILATYGADLSQRFSRRVRDTFLELGGEDNKKSPDHIVAGRPRLHTHIRSDVQQVGNFLTTAGGGMTAVGIGGAITGMGAKLLLIDDYTKNAEEADSVSRQESIYEWFTSTAYTRLEPGGSVIILATRWHKSDLIGRIKENQSAFSVPWQVIEIPAIAFNDGTPDVLGREPGEALWPERYPLKRLLQIKSVLGSYYWEAEYQQRPINKSDSKFDETLIQVVFDIPHVTALRRIRSWDLAATESKKADYSVGTLISQQGPPKGLSTVTYIEDVRRFQKTQKELEDILLETAVSDGREVPIIIEQEPGSSGKNYASYLANTLLKDFNVTVKPPESNKWLKAQPFLAAVERGTVKIRAGAWNRAWISEFVDFPGKNDDQVDSCSQGFNELYNLKMQSATWGRSTDPKTESGIILPMNNRPITGATFGRR